MNKTHLETIFGKRILKTAIATSITVVIANLLDLYAPAMAGISAIVSMTNTVFDSYKVSLNRMLSTIIGALIAMFFWYIDFVNYFSIFLGIVIVINLCNFFGWKKVTTLSLIVYLGIMLFEPHDDLTYITFGFHRLLDTFVGLIVGFFVNRLIFPPNHHESIAQLFRKAYRDLLKTMEFYLNGRIRIYPESIYQDMNDINQEIKAIQNDKKFHLNKEVDLKQVTEISALIYYGASFVIQLEENRDLPPIEENNLMRFMNLIGRPVKVRENTSDEDLKMAFNYYFDEFLNLMENLNNEIRIFEKGE
ncbi:MAG: aromatic acid exporter family protein [Tissierellia bacterium]|nr:aromatic acid exporter family protein [Tissierellia bacterium]